MCCSKFVKQLTGVWQNLHHIDEWKQQIYIGIEDRFNKLLVARKIHVRLEALVH